MSTERLALNVILGETNLNSHQEMSVGLAEHLSPSRLNVKRNKLIDAAHENTKITPTCYCQVKQCQHLVNIIITVIAPLIFEDRFKIVDSFKCMSNFSSSVVQIIILTKENEIHCIKMQYSVTVMYMPAYIALYGWLKETCFLIKRKMSLATISGAK